MKSMPCAVVVICAFAAVLSSGCGARSMSHTTWSIRFGPILLDELIVGRSAAGDEVWLATSLNALVHVRLHDRTYERYAIRPLASNEHPWGLARAEGQLWTLLDRRTLAEITQDGDIARRISLASAHVGVFGAQGQLLYQVLNFEPPADALTAGPPGETRRRSWGTIKTRALALDRGSAAALNLVSCGASAEGATPCWFPDEAALTITDAANHSRRLELEGLPLVQREVLLTSESPAKPIRDAFIAAAGTIWVIGSGRAPEGQSHARGGWLLTTYTATGQVSRHLQLPQPARLILAADDQSCLLLAADGTVVEVRP